MQLRKTAFKNKIKGRVRVDVHAVEQCMHLWKRLPRGHTGTFISKGLELGLGLGKLRRR